MRALQIVCLLLLSSLVYVTVLAEFADPSPADYKPVKEIQTSGPPVEEVRVSAAPEDWLTTCLADWDAQTHMTKPEWRRACERVSRERAYFHFNTASVQSVGESARGPRRTLARLTSGIDSGGYGVRQRGEFEGRDE
jgi:hypothetical protein